MFLRSIFFIKLIHTLIFFVLSACNVILLYSAITGRFSPLTWAALALLLVEGIVLIANGWTCPLTTYAEQVGALRGSVVDIFLPKWFADRIFPICGSLLVFSILLLVLRLVI